MELFVNNDHYSDEDFINKIKEIKNHYKSHNFENKIVHYVLIIRLIYWLLLPF